MSEFEKAKDKFYTAANNLGNAFSELSNTLNSLIEKADTIDLVHQFEFDNGFDFVEAIQDYEQRELYNAAHAVDILFSIEISQFVHRC